jgi:tRNA A37 N6-isopentenylltransferase MiaA
MLILKTKSLTSENLFKRETREVDEMFLDLLSVFQKYYDHAQENDNQILRSMLDLIILLSDQVHSSHRQGENTIDDFKIYIKALESSYKTVDGDFDKTVAQPAEKEAQEKDQEEEERAKALEEYSQRTRPKFYE